MYGPLRAGIRQNVSGGIAAEDQRLATLVSGELVRFSSWGQVLSSQ